MSDVVQLEELKLLSRGGADERRDRREATPGEDEAFDEVSVHLRAIEGAFLDDDRLQRHQPLRVEQSRADFEEVVVVTPVDRLEHLDRGKLRVSPGEVSVVVWPHSDEMRESRAGHPLASDLELCVGDRRCRHAAAVAGGGVDGEAAPAAADLEQLVFGRELEQPADSVELGALRVDQRLLWSSEQPTRVGHRRVEHQSEEVVGDVVVRSDVPSIARSPGPFEPPHWIGEARRRRPRCGRASLWRVAGQRSRIRKSDVRSSQSHQPCA